MSGYGGRAAPGYSNMSLGCHTWSPIPEKLVRDKTHTRQKTEVEVSFVLLFSLRILSGQKSWKQETDV